MSRNMCGFRRSLTELFPNKKAAASKKTCTDQLCCSLLESTFSRVYRGLELCLKHGDALADDVSEDPAVGRTLRAAFPRGFRTVIPIEVLWALAGIKGKHHSLQFRRFFLMLDTDLSGRSDLEEVLVGLSRVAAGVAHRTAPFRTFAPEPEEWEEEESEKGWRIRTDFLFDLYDKDANGWLSTIEVADMLLEYEDKDRKERALRDGKLRDAITTALGLKGHMGREGFARVAKEVPYLVDPSEDLQLALSSLGKQAVRALYALSDFWGTHATYGEVEDELALIGVRDITGFRLKGGLERTISSYRHPSLVFSSAFGEVPPDDVIDNDAEFDDGGEFDHFEPLDGEEHPEDHIGHHFSWQPPEDEREDGGSVQGEADDDWRDTGMALSPVRSPPPKQETAAAAAKREAETAKRRAADEAARAARATVEIENAYQEEVRAGAKKALKSLRSGPGGMEDAENMVLFGHLPPTVTLPECGGGSLLHALLQAPWAAAAASAGVGVGVADDGAGTLTHAIHSLLGIGVPSAQRDAKGRTAAQLAAEMGYYDAAWMLEDAEEKEPAGTTKRLLELTAGEAE